MQLVLRSVPKNIAQVKDYLGQIFIEYAIPEDYFADMLISLTEAVNNAMIHGNDLDDDKVVELRSRVKDDRIQIAIRDEGSGFDLDAIPDPRQKKYRSRPGGRGVMLMRELCSEVRYRDKGKTVILTFDIS